MPAPTASIPGSRTSPPTVAIPFASRIPHRDLPPSCPPTELIALSPRTRRQKPLPSWPLLFRRLNVTFRPIADGACDHASAESGYLPSRALRHLVRARTATCTAPGCLAQAVHCDIDHTTPHPAGPTCQCNLAPKCRRHHRCKQAPGWRVEQPAPGVMRWTLPSGRTHTTTPTEYEVLVPRQPSARS